MTIDRATMQQIIDRATEDPDFVVGLAQDPQGTLETAGIAVAAADAQAVGAALQAGGESLAEPLQPRISPAGLASLWGALAHPVAPAYTHQGHPVAPAYTHQGHPVAPDFSRN